MTRDNALIIAIIAALGAGNLAIGMMVQVIPLAMDAVGASKFLIGVNTMAGQAGVLLAGLSLTQLRKHFRSYHLVMCGLGLALFCFGGFAFTQPLWSWFPLRFILGLTMAAIYTTGEAWLQDNAEDKARARVIGSYMSSQTLTFAVGPFLIPYIGFMGPRPWLFGLAALAIGMLLMSRVKVTEHAHGEATASLVATARKGAFVFTSIFMTTLFEAFMLTFFTLYAIHNGLAVGTATQLLSFGIAACMLFFFPIGYLGDHWSRFGMQAICAGAALVLSLSQTPLINTLWIWPMIVVLRAGAFGSYLMGYSLLGDMFKGREMVAAASINSMIWGGSGVVGPPVAGYVFDRFGIDVLPYFMAACFVPVLAGLALKSYQSAPSRLPGSSV